MRVEERIMSILLAEKIKENPDHARKIGVKIINKDSQCNTESRGNNDEKNKLDILTFSKIYDMFGEKAAKETLDDVNAGKISADLIEKYIFNKQTKEQYSKWLKKQYRNFR